MHGHEGCQEGTFIYGSSIVPPVEGVAIETAPLGYPVWEFSPPPHTHPLSIPFTLTLSILSNLGAALLLDPPLPSFKLGSF